MKLEASIAFRYLRNQRAVQFSGLIAGLALIGITIGVAAVVCVASIFLGFRQLFEELMLRIDPHVRIVGRQGKYLPALDSLRHTLQQATTGVVAAVLDGRALAMHRGAMHVLQVRGYDDSSLVRLRSLGSVILVGTMTQRSDEIILGTGAADRLGVLPGDTIDLVSPEFIHSAAVGFGLLNWRPVRVVGLALTGDRTYDNSLALTTLSTAASLFATTESNATALEVFCHDREQGTALVEHLRKRLDQRYRVLSWYDLHRPMYAVMEWERIASFLLLSLIILLAVFNIVAMLTMTVVSKQRDIAILRTMGAPAGTVSRIFRLEGAMVGAIGTTLGAALGIVLCLGQQHFHWILLDTDVYVMQELPVALDWGAVAAVVLISMGTSLLASVPPARRAMHTPIAESLRFE